MNIRVLKEAGNDAIVLREGAEYPDALMSLDSIRSIVTSIQDVQFQVSRISDKEASVAVELLRSNIKNIVDAFRAAARDIGVDLQIGNPLSDYEQAQAELAEAIAQLESFEGPEAV